MKALLLAAGLGTRLRPITNNIPKCLVAIHHKPLLSYWLDLLFTQGIEQVLINTHYLPLRVEEYIQVSPWRDRITLVHEEELLGTGGTILNNREFFGEETFFVAHADNLTRFNLAQMIASHATRQREIEITMMTFDTDAPYSCGIVEVDDEQKIIGFYEKSTEFHGTRANAAVYLMEPTVINYLDSLGRPIIDLSTEVLPHFIGRMQAFHNADYHRDIGTPESLSLAETEY